MNDKKDIPVDIVPDEQLNRSLTGVNTVLDALSAHSRNNPDYVPFNVGTPTLARESFDEGVRQFDKTFDENQKQYNNNLAVKLAKSGSGSGTNKPPTDKERYQAIQSGAINYMQDLLKPQVAEERSLTPALDALRGTRSAATYNKTTTLSPEEAVQQTIKQVQSQLGDMGISATDYNNLVKMLYYSAGLEVPSGKTTTSGAMSDIEEIQRQMGLK